MAFFVPPELLPKRKESPRNPNQRLDLLLLSNAKKMNLSFDELNLFRMRDFIEFTGIYFDGEGGGNETRTATQADIDALLS